MRFLTKLLDWIGRFQVVQAIGQYAWGLWPLVWGIVTGGVAFSAVSHSMWTLVAASIVVACGCVTLLIVSLMQERKNPEHKLKFVGPHLGVDFIKQRGSVTQRKIEHAQLGCQFRNDATFPISLIVEYADTELEDVTPPRTRYPKPPVSIGPGGLISTFDSRMEMNGYPCGPLSGKLDIKIRYGYPGHEKFVLHTKGLVSIAMDQRGAVTSITLGNLPEEQLVTRLA
jgi:hypothetical protein